MNAPNPLLEPWDGPLGAPPFDKVKPEHFLPALQIAIDDHRHEIAAITQNPAAADFDNVIAALERSGEVLSRVRRLFWTLSSAQSTEPIRQIEGEISQLLSAHGSAISHDPALFARIAAVYENRDALALSTEKLRLVESTYSSFVRGGAALENAAKARFAEIDVRLAQLSVNFGQNVLTATNEGTLSLGQSDLDGLPEALIVAAAARAEAADEAGRYHFALDRSDYEALLTFSSRRDLRERMWRAFVNRCDGGEHDNWPLINEMLTLRDERANLLGYVDYATYQLDDSMARTPEAAESLLESLWKPALKRAAQETAELQEMIQADGGSYTLAPWDWRFYGARVRHERYALDVGAVKEHLRLDAVRSAAFETAHCLYGLNFHRRRDIPGYHSDVWAWEVIDTDGAPLGLLFTDYLARPEEHGGAWMGTLRVQEKLDGPVTPIVYLVANFAPAPDTAATRLSLDESRTLFHEFGHALHGLLSDVTYPTLSGTAVARDFVEFPSKFMENWIVSREVLADLGLPAELIASIGKAETYGQGFATVELVSCALVDLALHRELIHNAKEFVSKALADLEMPAAIGMRHRLPYFTHVFDGGYASAYYSYLWSEAIDADAFEAFRDTGNLFDRSLALRFRQEILAKGDSRDPMGSYIAFRGREPDAQALMRSRALAEV